MPDNQLDERELAGIHILGHRDPEDGHNRQEQDSDQRGTGSIRGNGHPLRQRQQPDPRRKGHLPPQGQGSRQHRKLHTLPHCTCIHQPHLHPPHRRGQRHRHTGNSPDDAQAADRHTLHRQRAEPPGRRHHGGGAPIRGHLPTMPAHHYGGDRGGRNGHG